MRVISKGNCQLIVHKPGEEAKAGARLRLDLSMIWLSLKWSGLRGIKLALSVRD